MNLLMPNSESPTVLTEKLQELFQSSKAAVGVIGLGYVGLPLAIEFGKNRLVVGFDINQQRVTELMTGKDSTLEVETAALNAVLVKNSTNEKRR